MEEWAWNVYPSTSASSMAVVGLYAVALTGVWLETGKVVESGVATERAAESEDSPSYEQLASKVREKKVS